MKFNKKLFGFVLAIILVLPIFFAGCSLEDIFGGKDVKLINGSYEVTTYSLNGTSQEQNIGKMAKIDNGTYTDWNGNVGTYEISKENITIKWSSTSLTGTVTKDTISINCEVDGDNIVMVLKFVEDVVLLNGTYEVTTYSVDGVSNTDIVGQNVTINNGTLTDWADNVATYQIVGNKIKITWVSFVFNGTVTKTSISINSMVNGKLYVFVMVKK